MPLETTEPDAKIDQPRLLPASLEDRIVKWIGRAGGVALLVVLTLLWLSLLTWTVTDPSLTFATGGRAQNALGPLGAIVSDLLLQMLGFAAVVALLTPMFWALDLISTERVPGFRVKGSFYPLSVLVLAGGLSALPIPSNWPLHHGLGGILGDVLYNMASSLFGILNPERGGLAAGISLLAAGFSALSYSIGLDWKELLALIERPPQRPQAPVDDEPQATEEAPLVAWWKQLWGRRRGQDAGAAGRASDDEADGGHVEPHLDGPRGPDWSQVQPHGGYYVQQGQTIHYVPPGATYDPTQGQVIYGQPGPGYPSPTGAYGHPVPVYAPMPQAVGSHIVAPQVVAPQLVAALPPQQAIPQAPQFVAVPVPAPMPLAMPPQSQQPHPSAPHSRPGEDAIVRDSGFDAATDQASRNIAERFAPGAVSSPRAPLPAEPQAAAEPSMPAKKTASGLLGGFSFRRSHEPHYKKPSFNMLKRAGAARQGPELTQTVLRGNARLLEDVLADFGVKGEVRDIKPGPVVTLFELEPARGTKSARVIGLADDIARSMSAVSARVAVVPGRNAIGIELPNVQRQPVLLREILETDAFRAPETILPIALGKSISGEPVLADLARMPHLLVAGTTGSGKSVGINAFILSLLFKLSPEECRMIMIDPKMLELSVYNGIPHLLTPVVTDPAKAVIALNWAVSEMEERYKRMAKLAVRNIDVFNNRVRNAKKRGEMMARTVQTGFDGRGQAIYEKEELDLEPMPYIVIVVDEFADLMVVAGKEIEAAVMRLAQMARAAGIHLVMATQRPSVDIVTGVIKANFPTRISFKVASKIDSRTILNDQGAEQLLGQGDMLFSTGAGAPARVHGAFVADDEVEAIAKFLREQGEPRYVAEITDGPSAAGPAAAADSRASDADDLYDRAVALVLRDRKASTSYIQRRLAVGYNRAADLMERMQKEGIISAPNAMGRRDILAGDGGHDPDVP